MSNVPEMVERVARAICAADRCGWDDRASDGSEIGPYWAFARAAIEAMRESTDAMEEAVYVEGERTYGNVHEGLPPDKMWRIMIDVALDKR